MSNFNPLAHLPSASTTMRSLLYPVHLLVKFGIILYDNELPGSHRHARVNTHQDREDVPHSSTPKPAAPKTELTVPNSVMSEIAAVDAPESSTPKAAASATTTTAEATYGHHILFGRAVACGKKTTVEQKAMIDASTQTDLHAVTDSSNDDPISETETAKKAMIEAPTQTDEDNVVGSSSNGSSSSPTTLINTSTDHSSLVDAEDNEHQDATGGEDFLLKSQNVEEQMQGVNQEIHSENQEIDAEDEGPHAENAQLNSSMGDLAKALSQEKEKSEAAAERAGVAEGRAAAAEGRVAAVAERATHLGTHMEQLGQDWGTQFIRAANAEAETMRVRLQMWGMQRDDFLPPDEESFPEQDQPREDLDQTQEQNTGLRVPLDAQEHAEVHEIHDRQNEETAGDLQDVTDDLAAAGSTSMVQEALLSTEMAAHQQTREELAQLKEQMTTKDRLLNTTTRLLKKEARDYEKLKQVQTDLQEELNEANLRISELESSTRGEALRRLRSRLNTLRDRINTLRDNAARMLEIITIQHYTYRNGIQLGTELHARLDKAEKLLKGALGRADGLMRLAEKWFPITVPVEKYPRKIVEKDVDDNEDNEPKVQLAIEGPPAEVSAMQNAEAFFGYEGLLDDVDAQRLVSDMFDVLNGIAVDNGSVADVEGEGPAVDISDFQNAEDVVSSNVPTATSEDTPKDPGVPGSLFTFGTPTQANEPEARDMAKESGFTFSIGTTAQETREATEDTAKKPVFAFGGTPTQESRQKTERAAKKPLFQFSATPVRETRQEMPSGATSSSQGPIFSQQTALPDVSGAQEAEESLEDEGEWTDVEEEDLKDEENDQEGAAEIMLGHYKVTRDNTSADEPDTPKAERDATATKHPVKTFGQDFKSGGMEPAFGAHANPNPVPKSNADSDNFNFVPKTDFNFGSTNAFKAGPIPFTAGSMAFGVTNEDEQKEGPSKKSKRSKTASTFEAAAGISLTSSSSDTKKEQKAEKAKTVSVFESAATIDLSSSSSDTKKEEATTKTTKAPMFEAGASVVLSSPSSDNKAALGASVDYDTRSVSNTSKFMFGVTTSTEFSFSPSDVTPTFGGFNKGLTGTSTAPSDPLAEKNKPVEVGGKDKKQGSTKEAANTPSFTAEESVKSISPASSEKAKLAPAKEPAKVEQVEMGPVAVTDSADANKGEAVSSEPDEGSFSITQTQPPGLSNIDTPSVTVANREQESINVDDEIRVDDNRAEASHTSSTPPSTSQGKVEGAAADIFGSLGFDAAALTRIVNSVHPAVPETLGGEDLLESLGSREANSASQIDANEARREVSHPIRTAAEIIASWKVEYRERAAGTLTNGVNGEELPTASNLWRDPEWPAALPPRGGPEPEWSAELPHLAAASTTASTTHQPPSSTQSAVSGLGAKYSATPTVSPAMSKVVAHMLETAPITIRNSGGHSNLIEVGMIERGIRDAMAAIEKLYIGPPAPPAIMPDFDTDVHFLSGDWIARRYTIRRTIQRQADGIKKEIESKEESLTRTEEAREAEVVREKEPRVIESPTLTRTDMRDVARFLGPRRSGRVARVVGQQGRRAGRGVARGEAPQVVAQPEIGNEEVSTTGAAEAQGAMATCEQERSAEPEVALEKEPQETVVAMGSNDGVELEMELQMAPQMRPRMAPPQMEMRMGLQMEDTATSKTQALELTAETGCESRGQIKEAAPKKPSGGLYIWSMRKRR